jgi:hypothetical protein
MEAKIEFGGDDGSAATSLSAWLRDEPDLRGRVRTVHRPPAAGELGGALQLVVDVVTSPSVATGAVLVALSKAVTTWLRERHSDVEVTITGPDGRTATVNVKRVRDAERLIEMALGIERARPEE